MSKKLDELEAKRKKLQELAERKPATYDSFESVYEETNNILLDKPYVLALIAAKWCFSELPGDIMYDMGPVNDMTKSGRVRNKFEKVVGTALKNFFLGLAVGITTILSVSAGLIVAAFETPFVLPKVAIEGPIIARNKAYNRRIEKAKKKLAKVEKEICEEVQKEARQDKNAEKDLKNVEEKAPVAKSPVLTTSKEDMKEESRRL